MTESVTRISSHVDAVAATVSKFEAVSARRILDIDDGESMLGKNFKMKSCCCCVLNSICTFTFQLFATPSRSLPRFFRQPKFEGGAASVGTNVDKDA